ncbi:aminopeptidase P family protein [Flavicella marina]|uniref:aminopeptidase P family protein n=1 Tax=Flavicella marina TaxID=1475951 RepID=UPI0012650C1A|nr:aminopeptidase P family protein [Flavicella marina]
MKYDAIDCQLFIKNRKKFISKLKPKSIAFFNSNDIYPISADSTLPFAQHRDIFYLSGVDQEESVLFLCPNASNEAYREILFVRETNAHIAVWEGAKLSKEQATKTSGVKTVFWLSELDSVLEKLMTEVENVYVNINGHHRAQAETETREDRFINMIKEKYPNKTIEESNPILQSIRSIKEPEELALIQKACDITEKGFRRILPFVKPGVWEYEIEAELIHEFIKNRSKGFAYTPIVASGNSANVLHYIENNQQCKSGDLILMDVAAEYANYSSDLTRTIPVSGCFSARQKEVYNAVNKIKKEATKLLVPGTILKTYQEEVAKMMTSELIALKLLDKADIQNEDKEWPAYKKYFMHSTSHHMGLDTHDYGVLTDPMEANMVFTVEPGIYIPEEGFGIRLEDDVVVQASGAPFNLMQNIPIEAEEIEELMNS